MRFATDPPGVSSPPVPSGISNTRFTWAPEFYVEGDTVRIIASVAQTTCSQCFRPYVYTAGDSSLTSWSGPQQMWGLGFNYIDTYVVKSGIVNRRSGWVFDCTAPAIFV